MASSYTTSADSLARVIDGTTKVKGATPNPIMDAVEATQEFIGESGASQAHNTDLLAQLCSLKPTFILSYHDVSTIAISAGVSRSQNSTGSVRKLRKNTEAVEIDADELDGGGSFANNTAYDVYTDADAGATTVGFVICAVGSTPSAVTSYELIGGFATDGSGQVIESSVWSMAEVPLHYKKMDDILSIVTTGDGIIDDDDTVPASDRGLAVMEIDIVIAPNTKRLLINAEVPCNGGAGGNHITLALFEGAGASAIKTSIEYVTGYADMMARLVHVIETADLPARGKVTYKLRIGAGYTGTLYVNADQDGNGIHGGALFATMTVVQLPT